VTVKAHKGETITAADGFYVVAGHNPGVHGAILTEALSSRFTFQFEVATFSGLVICVCLSRFERGGGHSQVDRSWVAEPRLAAVEGGEFLLGFGEADLQAADLAGPAVGVCFVDAFGEVPDYRGQPGPLRGVDVQHRAADAPLTELTLVFGQVAACFRVRLASLSA
jgi:hypothetical protein